MLFWPLDTVCFRLLRSFMVPSGILETHLYSFWRDTCKITWVFFLKTNLRRLKSPKVSICSLQNHISWRKYIKEICDFFCPNWLTGLTLFIRPNNEGRQLICPKSHNLHKGQCKNSSQTPTFIHYSANYMLTTTAPDRQLTSDPLTGFFEVHTLLFHYVLSIYVCQWDLALIQQCFHLEQDYKRKKSREWKLHRILVAD